MVAPAPVKVRRASFRYIMRMHACIYTCTVAMSAAGGLATPRNGRWATLGRPVGAPVGSIPARKIG